MNYDYQQTGFSKAVLTGLFAGLMATLACLAYDFFYRLNTGFTMSAIINVPSIIIACHILLLVCGMLYFVFKNKIKKGSIIFIGLFVILTVYLIVKGEGVERSPIHQLTVQFRGLLLGMIVIIGLCASILIPYLSGNKKFEENVL
ncbi:hypothetical protein QTN47_07170 [Danxiaibacter flavus]|uniref:Uncharacterized protein n=1 Tax=Danxiaibacter flavus TaxID=3049108 RepID=A0ABV3ZDJ6_9BACT|nr:hypothetical protein QNM32_07170 [Chitinophagaceae bacterium DXS]